MNFIHSIIEQFTLTYCSGQISIFALFIFMLAATLSVYEIFFFNFVNLYGFFFFFNKWISNSIANILTFTKLGQKIFYLSFFTLNYTYVFNWCTAVPFFYPLLSFYGTAFFFTWTCFLGSILTVLTEQQFDFFAIFTCTSVSIYLLELFTTINIASYAVRFFSLVVRALASSAASSILLNLTSNIAIFFFFYTILVDKFFLFTISCLFLFAINILEFFVPILQAQIFNFLVYIYYNESIINYNVYFSFFFKKKKEQSFVYSLTNEFK